MYVLYVHTYSQARRLNTNFKGRAPMCGVLMGLEPVTAPARPIVARDVASEILWNFESWTA